MIRYHEPVIRPPSEADSLILQATLGCSHNRCAFCFTYRGKRFRVRPPEELAADVAWAAGALPGTRKVFLADGDALVLSTERLLEILELLAASLPRLRRVSAYATPKNLAGKSVADLRRLRDAGLTLLYVGLESGDDEILEHIDKGATADEMAAACARPHEAGIKQFVTVVLGLGGTRLSERHAAATARLIDRIRPRFAAALTLMEPDGWDYAARSGIPGWRRLTARESLVELSALISGIESGGIIFRSDHVSNYLPLAGTLQKDKDRLLAEIDELVSCIPG